MVATTPVDKRQRLASVQILRGIAAMLVVVVHAGQRQDKLGNPANLLSTFSYIGSIGVDLFFIISGFVMALTMQRYAGGEGAARFLVQRFQRVAPPFYIWSLVLLAGFALQGRSIDPIKVLNSLTISPVFDWGTYDAPLLFVGWTLAFEATFYALVAVIIFLRLPPWSLIPIIIVFALVPFVDTSEPVALRFFFNSIMLEFAMGVLAYVAWSKKWLRRRVVIGGAVLGLATVALLLPDRASGLYRTATIFDNSFSAMRALVWGVPCLLIFNAALEWEPRKGLASRVLMLVGDASYSIYLTHQFILFGFSCTIFPGDIEALILISGCAAFGIVAYLLVERPILRHLSRRRKKKGNLANAS